MNVESNISACNLSVDIDKNKGNNCNTSFTSQQSYKAYLCSIENELSLDDIHLILSNAKLVMFDICLKPAVGNFKNKKIIEVHSEKKTEPF